MQFMPKTAAWVGEQMGMPAQPLSPAWSIQAAIWYDRYLYDRLKFRDECHQWGATLAAYNGGLSNVYARQKMSEQPSDYWYWTSTYTPRGVSNAAQLENYNYPRKIVWDHQKRYRQLGGKLVCL